jgi:D-amino-acid dehydrogenase
MPVPEQIGGEAINNPYRGPGSGEKDTMARTDAIVLGAGIVGTATALQLARRGLGVALVDRREPGEETSYGNAGIIEANTIFPPAFPSRFSTLMRIALKRAPEANYHLRHLPKVAPWLVAFAAASAPQRLVDTAHIMRPLFALALTEHEALLADANAAHHLRREGWLKLYRTEKAFAGLRRELDLAGELGIAARPLDQEAARALEPHLAPVFRHAVHWPGAASVDNPLAVTKAYAERLERRGGIVLTGDARSLHRADGHWRVDTEGGPVDAPAVVLALGPFAPDILKPLGIDLPLGIKRGYHLHFTAQGNATLTRPVVDIENGYCLAPMQQGIRLTTGAEFAARAAPPTPVQLDRLLPDARALFPLAAPVEAKPWMGCRPCFADSRPVIGPAPGRAGLWLAYGHGHWGLTLAAVTGRLLAELITGRTPFCDPAPYGAERFKH